MLCAFRRASVGIARRSVLPSLACRPRASPKGASLHHRFTFTRAVSQMADAPSRGAFVVFEGVDRCGKSSQTKQLVEALNARGIAAELWCYPDRTTDIGKMINAYLTNNAELSDAAVHLLFSANRWEKRYVSSPATSRGGHEPRPVPTGCLAVRGGVAASRALSATCASELHVCSLRAEGSLTLVRERGIGRLSASSGVQWDRA